MIGLETAVSNIMKPIIIITRVGGCGKMGMADLFG